MRRVANRLHTSPTSIPPVQRNNNDNKLLICNNVHQQPTANLLRPVFKTKAARAKPLSYCNVPCLERFAQNYPVTVQASGRLCT